MKKLPLKKMVVWLLVCTTVCANLKFIHIIMYLDCSFPLDEVIIFVAVLAGANATWLQDGNSAALYYGNKCWVKRTFIYS